MSAAPVVAAVAVSYAVTAGAAYVAAVPAWHDLLYRWRGAEIEASRPNGSLRPVLEDHLRRDVTACAAATALLWPLSLALVAVSWLTRLAYRLTLKPLHARAWRPVDQRRAARALAARADAVLARERRDEVRDLKVARHGPTSRGGADR